MATDIERADKLEKKFTDKLPEDWRVRVQAMSTDELKAAIIEVSHNENENQRAKEADEVLAEAHAKHADLAAPYKDNSSIHKLKIKFVLRELERNGAI